MDPKVLILAGGKMSRWRVDGKLYMGIEKHFAKINGEPIIKRTIRQLNERGLTPVIIADKAKYELDGAQIYYPEIDPARWECDKFMNSREIWSLDRTIILLGDVYFSDQALDIILGYKDREWQMFGRAFNSDIKNYGEGFAFSFYSEHHDRIFGVLNRAIRLHNEGIIDGGWEYYKAWIGLPDYLMNTHLVGPNFTNINDETDDLDYPEDYDNMLKKLTEN